MRVEALIDALFEVAPAVRYVAVHPGSGEPVFLSKLKHDLAPTADLFEERVINPSLLDLARRRGEIGVGGLESMVVRYQRLSLLLLPLEHGHITIGLDPEHDAAALTPVLSAVALSHGARLLARNG